MESATANNTPGATGRVGLTVRLVVILTAALVGAWPAFAIAGYLLFGVAGIWSALAAGLACWVGMVTALLITAVAQGPHAALISLLGGMAFRLGVPFLFGLMAQNRLAILAEGRIFGMVLAYYLVALPIETWLSLKLVNRASLRPVAKAV